MSNEAWKDAGNCKHCRREKYCRKECSAHKRRMRKIIELSARTAVGKYMVKHGAELAEEAKANLAMYMTSCEEDATREAVDAVYEGCRRIAMSSTYTTAQIVNGVIGTASATGDSTRTVLAKMEARYLVDSSDTGE